MASTYLSLHYHFVFTTKCRAALIGDEWIAAFHEYIGGTVIGLDGFPQGVGGTADHVHLLVGLRATHRVSDFVRELKKSSSSWARKTHESKFGWQEGYGAFSVGPPDRARVKKYIANQKAHHAKIDSQTEYLHLLKTAEINYDPHHR